MKKLFLAIVAVAALTITSCCEAKANEPVCKRQRPSVQHTRLVRRSAIIPATKQHARRKLSARRLAIRLYAKRSARIPATRLLAKRKLNARRLAKKLLVRRKLLVRKEQSATRLAERSNQHCIYIKRNRSGNTRPISFITSSLVNQTTIAKQCLGVGLSTTEALVESHRLFTTTHLKDVLTEATTCSLIEDTLLTESLEAVCIENL